MFTNNIKSLFLFGITLVLMGCGQSLTTEEQTNTQHSVAVDVAKVIKTEYSERYEFTGNIEAPETIELRPRVSGYIAQVHFTEGSIVKKGQLLFSIVDEQFAARVAQLRAEMAMAQSQYTLRRKNFERANTLGHTSAISREQIDLRESTMQQAKASLDAVQAQLVSAEIELDYTKVRAPISGKISQAFITQGNFVSAGQSVLSNLVSVDDVHAYFDASQSIYTQYIANQQDQGNVVLMGLGQDKALNFNGYVDFVDNRVNPATGTIRVRASFANQDGKLIPGMFARLNIIGDTKQRVLIDDKAIGTDLSNKYVLVLDENKQVQYRAVTLGDKIHGLREITEGLQGDETIVVNGLMRVRPGASVQANEREMAPMQSMQAIAKDMHRIESLQERLAILHADEVKSTLLASRQGE